ncbi:MAG: fibronectin type III domain-containing protein [Elusimicrobiota bacterium]
MKTCICYLLSAICYLLSPICLFASSPHTITVDGNLSDWSSDELIYDDPTNDGAWGQQNQVDNLYLTWDSNNLYIGVSGVQKDGNCFVLYLDAGRELTNIGQKFGDYSDVSQLKDSSGYSWWWSRNHKFPFGFLPDYQLHLYEMQLKLNEGHGLFRYTTSSQTVSVEMSSSAYIGGGTGVYGSFEVAIPWAQIYPDYGGSIPQNATLQLVAVMSGGNDTSNQLLGSVHDSIPDQLTDFTTYWHGAFTFDTWLTIPLDQDRNKEPDINRSPVPRNLLAKAGDGCAFLSWQKKGFWEKNLNGYKLYYKKQQSFAETDFSLTGATSVFVSNTTSYILTGLENNVSYYFVLTAINTDGTESGCCEEEYCYIHGPTIFHTSIEKFAYPGKNITVSANITDSSELKIVNFYYKVHGGVCYSENVLTPTPPTSASYNFTIPGDSVTPEGIDYYFLAENNSGDVNIASSTIVIVSTESGNYSVEAGLELKLSDTSTYPTKIVIPPYALDRTQKIYVEVKSHGVIFQDNQSPIPNPQSPISDIYPVCVYDFYGENKTAVAFSKNAEIYLKYFDDDLDNNYSEITLKPFVWTGTEWLELKNITQNTTNNFVKGKTGHISRFAVFYTNSSGSAALRPHLQKVVRSTFIPDRGEVVEFNCAQLPTKIEIFNTYGARVKKITELTYWDGRDENGTIVSAGVYIYQIHFGKEIISGSCVVVK